MEHPLFNGTGISTLFRAFLSLPQLAPGQCLRTIEEFQAWFQTARIDVESRDGVLFAYTAGPASSATADDRDKPRFLFDSAGRYLGLALWIPEVQNWSLAGVPGELRTIVRTEGTVAEDIEAKHLHGWILCDGSDGSAPDLTPQEITIQVDIGTAPTVNMKTSEPFTPAPQPFFQGTAPDWDIYTVCKVA